MKCNQIRIRDMQTLIPSKMALTPEGVLQIEWADGHQSRYTPQNLRGSCPCAECVDEITGKRQVFPQDIAAGIRPREARPVGRYAYQFVWSDGHDTGLYSYEYLRALCECEDCLAKRNDTKEKE